jgi:hypothetical protein
MSGFLHLLAVLLPCLLGTGILLAVEGRPAAAWGWMRIAGEGFLLGLLVTAVAMMLPGLVPANSFYALGLPLLLCAGFLVAFGARRPACSHAPPRLEPLEWPWLALAAAVVALHAYPLWREAQNLPTLPWDAWSTWMFKARAWYEQPAFLPFVDPATALAQPDGAALATLAPHYPNALPRIAVWIASAQPEWSGARVRSLWPVLWLALGAGFYGGLRGLGLKAAVAAVATAAMLSLPLVNHHAALAGYADLWISALVALSALRLAAWALHRRWQDAALGLVFALLLPTLKLEGTIWLLGLVGAFLLCWVPVRWRIPLVFGGLVLLLALALWVGLSLPLPGLGWISLGWGRVEVPGTGVLELYWRPVLPEVLTTLFLLPNWHLLWYALPVVLLAGWRRLARQPSAALLGWFLLYAMAFIAILFFFTDASRWAENLTSVNRVLLQVVPVTVALAALAIHRPTEDAHTAR